jgi:hypothetical protein
MKRKLAGMIGREFGRLAVYDGGLSGGQPGVVLLSNFIGSATRMFIHEPDLIALARAVVEAAEPEAKRTANHSVVELLPDGFTLYHYSGDRPACKAVLDRFRRNGNDCVRLVTIERSTIMREVEDGEGVEG